jgi:VanZ family protein
MDTVWADEYVCVLGALAAAAFIIFGSLVPFDLRRPDALSPVAWLEQVRFKPWSAASPTDVLVNVAVDLPFGFFLMGALRSRRRQSYLGAAAGVIVVVCISAVLGTAVELLQVLSPTRISAWSDVFAQGLGASIGALLWAFNGRTILRWLRLRVRVKERAA